MNIRKALKTDAASIVDFQLAMALETESIKLDRLTVLQGVEALFSDSSKGEYYVAEEASLIIGCLMITYEWSDWRNGTVLWIQSVYVHKAHRNRGVYSQLYLFVKKMVSVSTNFRGIRLYVDKSNSGAQQVYQKLGMNGQHYQLFEWMKEQ